MKKLRFVGVIAASILIALLLIPGCASQQAAPQQAVNEVAHTVDVETRTNKIDLHGHFHDPAIFAAIEEIVGERWGTGWNLLKMQADTFMQTLTLPERMALMDQYGIEKAVFSFPSASLYVDEKNKPEQRKEIARWLNDYFAECHEQYPDRAYFWADVAFSMGDMSFSIAEMKRATQELGLTGVALPSNVYGKLLYEPEFEPFFAEAEKLGVPIWIHPDNPYGMEKMMKYYTFSVIGFPADQALMMTYLILDGFMERHPDIKIIVTHLGGTLPFIYQRMDIVWYENTAVPPGVGGSTDLTKSPSEYLKDFYYDSAIGNPESIVYLKNLVGVDRIMFGTDHPYIQNAEKQAIGYINQAMLTDEERDKIYSQSAQQLLGLD